MALSQRVCGGEQISLEREVKEPTELRLHCVCPNMEASDALERRGATGTEQNSPALIFRGACGSLGEGNK